MASDSANKIRPEAEGRSAVVAEALTWRATPYHHMGDGEQLPGRELKGVAIDCAQILVEVYAAAGVIDWFSTGKYPRDWHLHQSEERYVGFIERLGREFDWRADPVKPADIVVFQLGRTFSHGGIVTVAEPLTILHAYAHYGFVEEGPVAGTPLAQLNDGRPRPMRAFSLWERAQVGRQADSAKGNP